MGTGWFKTVGLVRIDESQFRCLMYASLSSNKAVKIVDFGR